MEIPVSFYYLVGTLILTNIGTIGSVLIFGGKSVWWLSKLDSRIDDAKETAVRAHIRVDKLEEKSD